MTKSGFDGAEKERKEQTYQSTDIMRAFATASTEY
jgi:hypothetical protein